MERLQLFRSEFADAFLFLPLLILGFSFIYGLLTSNVGLLYLFLGELTVVPSLAWLFNEKDAFLGTSKLHIVWTLVSCAVIFGVISGATKSVIPADKTPDAAFTWYVVPVILLAAKWLVDKDNKMSLLDLLNPAVWMGMTPTAGSDNGVCALIPGVDNPWNNPSLWNLYITFFSGYILSNAVTLYNLPAPTVNRDDYTSDQQLNQQKGEVQTRVGNRKTIAVTVMGIISIVFLVLLYFRFNKTPCESGMALQFAPLLYTFLIGYAAFTVAATCGARPVDVLGLVQGMIQPTAPVVCMASEAP